MAKKPATATKNAAPKPNLFAKAKAAAVAAPPKSAGSVIELPKELDSDGKLIGESALLNSAVTEAIEADAEAKAASNKSTLAKNRLVGYATGRFVEMTAKLGVLPPTPVKIINHNGESVTFIVMDKSQQYPIRSEQIDLFRGILGDDGAARIVNTKTVYAFNPATMDEKAANADMSVAEIVAELVSNALMSDSRLSDEQKGDLITSSEKTYIAQNTLTRVAELCGADAGRIGQFIAAAGTAFTKYIKT